MADNFFDLGGTSLSAFYLLGAINKTFGRQLPFGVLYHAPTVESLAILLGKEEPCRQWSSLIPLQTQGSKPPFFWIHGEASDTFLPRYLGNDQPVYGLVHQSDDGKPAQYTSVKDIASHYLNEIATIQKEGAYFLGGYCFGGLVALEIGQQLKARGDDVALLVLLEPSVLKTCGRTPLSSDTSVHSVQQKGIRAHARRHLAQLRGLAPRQQATYIGARTRGKVADWIAHATVPATRKIKGVVCDLCLRFGYTLPIWVRSFYILRLYQRARAKYTLQPFPGQVTLFVQESEWASTSNWDGLATEGVEVQKITASSHTDILKQPHLQHWAEKLKTALQNAQKRISN